MDCPVCHKPMEEVEVGGVKVDFCRNGCKGIFFDNFEIQKLDEKHEGDGPILQEMLSAERHDDSRSEKLTCPRCGVKMRRHKYSFTSDVYIDHCYGCNGIWLDGGELKAIREQFASEQQRKANVDQILNTIPEFKATLQEMEEERKKINKRRSLFQNLAFLFRRY